MLNIFKHLCVWNTISYFFIAEILAKKLSNSLAFTQPRIQIRGSYFILWVCPLISTLSALISTNEWFSSLPRVEMKNIIFKECSCHNWFHLRIFLKANQFSSWASSCYRNVQIELQRCNEVAKYFWNRGSRLLRFFHFAGYVAVIFENLRLGG